MRNRVNYRRLAFEHYATVCAYCGFGIPDVLEVAHVDGDRENNDVGNLVILCPTCHKMHDVDLISTEAIIEARDHRREVDWSKRLKDAGAKAAATRRRRTDARKGAGRKAALTRKRRAAARKAVETRRHKRQARA